MNEIFDIKRFGEVVRRIFIVRRKELRSWAVVAGIIVVVMCIVSNDLTGFHEETSSSLQAGLRPSAIFFWVGFVIWMFVGASLVIGDMKNRGNWIGEIMLPASNLEKFLARLLFISVGLIAAIAVGVVLGDLVQMAVTAIVHRGSTASFSHALLKSVSDSDFDWTDLCSHILVLSLFVLGGVLFRKMAWLKTSLILGAVFTLIFGVVAASAYALQAYTGYEMYLPKDGLDNAVLNLMQLPFAALFFWIAYRKYCRAQVINNRWFN